MIEAEIKVWVENPARTQENLDLHAIAVPETYSDTYFDSPDRALAARGEELRVRTVNGTQGTRHLLTFKAAPVDEATQSKPELEVLVEDPAQTAAILTALGFPSELQLTKKCINYTIDHGGRRLLATLVTVPELDGTFLEVETHAEPDALDGALAQIADLLDTLDLPRAAWTTDTYTDAVRRARQTGRPTSTAAHRGTEQ
jgi:adenylate cyclase, class 2